MSLLIPISVNLNSDPDKVENVLVDEFQKPWRLFPDCFAIRHLLFDLFPVSVILAGGRFCGRGKDGGLPAFRSFSMLNRGVWAEVKVGGQHLRLFSEEGALGVQASAYNVNAKNWIAPSETVEDSFGNLLL